jgi:hypothetical protein
MDLTHLLKMQTTLSFETSGKTYPVGNVTSQKTRIPITYPAEGNSSNKYVQRTG